MTFDSIMNKLNQLSKVILPVFLLMMSCNYNSIISSPIEERINKTKDNMKTVSIPEIKWKAVDLPILGEVLALYKDDIFVVGEQGIISLNQEMEVKKLPPIKIIGSYLTTDGGLIKGSNRLEKKNVEYSYYDSHLCFPQNAAFLSNNLYVFSICEHTTQLWKVTFDTKNTLLSLTNFTYHNIDSGDNRVFGPTGLPSTTDKVLLPSFIKKGPALVTEDTKTGNLKVAWQGKEEDGGIVSIDFIGKQGWMLLSGGKILRSYDDGETWQYFSNIPSEAEHNVVEMKFRNEEEGYIVGDKIILSTVDGGKTWKFQNKEIDKILYKIVLDNNIAAIYGGKNSLYINSKGENQFTEIETKPKGDITDLIVYDEKLFVLIDGKLYFASVK